MKTCFLIFSFVLLSLIACSQEISGRVVDSGTGNPLAFVNIVFDNTSRGVTSDIDGKFEIYNISNIDSLHFIYVGYNTVSIALSSVSNNFIIVKMKETKYILSAVAIYAKDNPAHRIIRKCAQNRNENNPENLKSFSYKAYHKMVFTAKSAVENRTDSIKAAKSKLVFGFSNGNTNTDTSSTDSLGKMQANFFKSQHLFVMESISKHTYKKPDKHYEKVIATRISGLQDPLFVMLANQFQSFSFYQNNIKLLDKQYVNPISVGSTKKYFFLIEDTIIQNRDTVFVISFRPRKNTHFKAMKGVLYINTNKYAIQNVIAEPADTNNSLAIRIQQKYEFIDGAWFPVQLNTNLEFGSIDLNGEPLVGIGKSYISDIEINKSVKSTHFSNVVLDIDKKAAKQPEVFWQHNRTIALDSLDIKTYKVIDSLGKAEHFDRKLFVLRTLTNGSIPIGTFNLQLNKIMNYNDFEGFRLGIGLQTNRQLSDWFQLSAYGARSFRDKQWKYGSGIAFNIWKRQNMKLLFNYTNDVMESAQQFDFAKNSFINANVYRDVLVKNMVYFQDYSACIEFRAIPNFSWSFGAKSQYINSPTNYQYIVQDNKAVYVSKGDFNVFETHIGLRFAYHEKIIRNRLYQISMGTKFPILNLHYTRGIKGVYLSELNYEKLDLQLDFAYNINYIGRSSWRIVAAKAIGDLPWYKLYNGKGSYVPFFVESPYSFGTMRLNEFLSDEYLAVYFRHDFGSLLFGDKPFIPHPIFISSFTIGDLQNKGYHKNLKFNTLEKGYYESGIMLNSILKNNVAEIGIGIMYRYGPYSFSKEKDNFAYKLTIGFGI